MTYDKMLVHLSQYTPQKALDTLRDEDFLQYCGLTNLEVQTLYHYFLNQLKKD